MSETFIIALMTFSVLVLVVLLVTMLVQASNRRKEREPHRGSVPPFRQPRPPEWARHPGDKT